MSSPAVTNFDNVDGKMTFDMLNVDVSVVNGLRRVLLSNMTHWHFKHFRMKNVLLTLLKIILNSITNT